MKGTVYNMRQYNSRLFSQKHYETVAFRLRNGCYDEKQREVIIDFITDMFKVDSSKFDEFEFLKQVNKED